MYKQKQIEVYVDEDGIIREVFHGDMEKETIEEAEKLTMLLRRKLESLDVDPLIFVDLRDTKTHSLAARKASYKSLKTSPFKKIAILNKDKFTKEIGESVIEAAGKKKSVKFFNTDDEAINWLKETPNNF